MSEVPEPVLIFQDRLPKIKGRKLKYLTEEERIAAKKRQMKEGQLRYVARMKEKNEQISNIIKFLNTLK